MRITASRLKDAGFSGSYGVYTKGVLQVFHDVRGWFLGHEHPLDVAVHSMETLMALESSINRAYTESEGRTAFEYSNIKSA